MAFLSGCREKYDLIFLDPPYQTQLLENCVQAVVKFDILSEHGIMVCESAAEDVLEPVQAAPVIIEDNCFIGSRSIVVEGAHICREAVLGSNTVITGSTHIIDVTGDEPVEYKGYVPPRSVVVSGTYNKKFPAGEYGVQCALIIGRRKESTDKKTSLNDCLRDFSIS